ncbi:related to Golgi apparatus membrane protein TVP38 [Saccharomycodes ludwigii]|uniref:Golgi apparatus membrane protein TVP38 n=1 Tax=Saccharomycodes ludwigii TaxID=36035 RepID=A0A376B3Z7_9ASCO|nr:hypothetical protein SCDLUD_005286 [Saccharomycodes ludwigii]KAH3898939.1 hypothetical protein SCDLUD_005286 [Saccharomycodes ludwigii]SSD59397.1 related to Golgi apparatus membrane protein TVP38 [Saccharomycodes ludwigii]
MTEQYEARVSSWDNNNSNNINNNSDFINDHEFIFNSDTEGDFDDFNGEENFLELYNLSPRQRFFYKIKHFVRTKFLKKIQKLKPWQKIILSILSLIGFCMFIVLLVFHNKILKYLVDTSNELRENIWTPFILFACLFFVAFPPLIGYSLFSTACGLVYGISFQGWIILAAGTILGSVSSFIVFTKFFSSQAEKLLHSNKKFEAVASILQDHDSYWLLSLIRLCPFPYSLTNGALAGIYGISVKNFAIASTITSPKLIIYLFIGSRLKRLGQDESEGSKLFDLLSIFFAIFILTLTAWILYFKTKKRYLELESTAQDPFADDRNSNTTVNDPTSFDF